MRNKKGQFYLVAAIIIVMVISGIVSVRTYAVMKSEPRQIRDISSELREEGMRIVDYGIFQGEGIDIRNDRITEFIDDKYGPYFLKKTENSNIFFVYGNKDEINYARYDYAFTGDVFSSIGGVSSTWETSRPYLHIQTTTISPGEVLEVTLDGRDYEFKIRDNEMFYFLITQEREGEVYVERN